MSTDTPVVKTATDDSTRTTTRITSYTVPKPLWKKTGFDHRNWLVECPSCGEIHIHGAADGPRSPHCRRRPLGARYELEIAREDLPRALWPAFGRRIGIKLK
jgi:hypothetical protein